MIVIIDRPPGGARGEGGMLERTRWVISLWGRAACAQTSQLPESVKQGGVLRVRGPAAASSARMEERTIRLFPQPDGGAFGLMPIPADQKPGPYRVSLLDRGGAVLAGADVAVV